MKEILKYHYCFVCGDLNDRGLKAKFYLEGERAVARLTTEAAFEGYRGIYHGGVLSAMLDEVMVKAILARDVFAVTAEMTVRYLRPVGIGVELTFIGEITEAKGRRFVTRGEVVDSEGVKYATATGKYLEARPELKEQLIQSTEQ